MKNTRPPRFSAARTNSQNASKRPSGTCESQNEKNTTSKRPDGVHANRSATSYSTFASAHAPIHCNRFSRSVHRYHAAAAFRQSASSIAPFHKPVPAPPRPGPLDAAPLRSPPLPETIVRDAPDLDRSAPCAETTDRIRAPVRDSTLSVVREFVGLPKLTRTDPRTAAQ